MVWNVYRILGGEILASLFFVIFHDGVEQFRKAILHPENIGSRWEASAVPRHHPEHDWLTTCRLNFDYKDEEEEDEEEDEEEEDEEEDEEEEEDSCNNSPTWNEYWR